MNRDNLMYYSKNYNIKDLLNIELKVLLKAPLHSTQFHSTPSTPLHSQPNLFQFYVNFAKTMKLRRRDAVLKVTLRGKEGKEGKEGEKSGGGGGKGREVRRWVVKPTWPEFVSYILATKRSQDVSSKQK